jgi:uncharacterized protein (DUF952 family)
MTILHFCPLADWEAARQRGVYAADTLDTEGFIHCSTPAQVHLPANALVRGRTDLVLLEIDEARLPEAPRYELGFPHVYGPIPLDAIVAVHDFPPGADGYFAVPPGIARDDG